MFVRSKSLSRALVLATLAGLFAVPSPANAVGDTFSGHSATVTVNEQTPTPLFESTTLTSSTADFSGTSIEFAVDTSTTADKLFLETVTVASTTAGQISVVGSTVFKGNGTSADVIGTIDTTYDGTSGKKLKVTFSNTFTNGSFSDGTSNVVGDVTTLNGWTAYGRRVYLGAASTVAGWPTPYDSTFPRNIDRTTNADSSGASQTYTVDPRYTDRSGSGYSVRLATSGGCNDGYCIIRGPYIVSNDPVYLQVGDSVSFWWSALGASDAYDVYGYLLNVSNGNTIKLLDSTGANASATQSWTQVTETITALAGAGNYKFVFLAGTWDATGGQAEGASLLLDDVSVSVSNVTTITATDLENLAKLLRYSETSDAPSTTRTVRIATTGGATGGVQTITVAPVNDPIAMQSPTKITRLRTMVDSSTATGTLVAYDPDLGVGVNINPTFGISGGTLNGVTNNVEINGLYGKLSVDTATGAYSYDFFVDSITALSTDASETIIVTATDGSETATANLVIRLYSPSRTISFSTPASSPITKSNGDVFPIVATPSAGDDDGTITYSAGASTACTIVGTSVKITAATGTCSVTATISGGTYWDTATTTSPLVVNIGAAGGSSGPKPEVIIPSPTFVTVPTLYGTQGQNGSVSPVAVNANTYEVVGSLPAGLTLNTTTGVISGVPTVFGTFSITIIARNDGGGTSATFQFILAKAPKPTPNLDAITPIAEKQGNPYVTLNGAITEATIRPNGTQNGMEVIANGWTLALSAMQTDGKAAPLSPKQSIIIKDNQQVYVGGTGFKANSEVRVYFFSTPRLLGKTTTDGKGEFAAVFPMLSDVVEGDHLIQVNGISPDNDLRSATLPAIYEKTKVVTQPETTTVTETPKTPVVTPEAKSLVLVVPFAFNKYSLGTSQISILKSLKKTKATEIKVVGYAQPSSPQPDIALSLDRAIEVRKSISKIVPVAKFTTRGSGPKNNPLCAPYKNKCVVIYVKA